MGSEKKTKKSLKSHRIQIFFLTFLTYSAIYSTRSTWSYCKKYIQETLQIPNEVLGTIDMIFLLMYAFSMNLVGNVDVSYKSNQHKLEKSPEKKDTPVIFNFSDNKEKLKIFLKEAIQILTLKKKLTLNIPVKRLLLFSMIPASIVFITIASFPYIPFLSPYAIVLVMAANGACQGPVYPSLINCFGNWFKKANRGLMMGVWACNSNIGNILGLQLGSMIIQSSQMSWELCILTSGFLLLSMGIINYIYLEPYPESCGIYLDEEVKMIELTEQKKPIQSIETQEQQQQTKISIQEENNNNTTAVKQVARPLSYKEIINIPSVLIFMTTECALKSTMYGFIFWLPKYLDEINLQSHSASIPQLLQVGTILGGIMSGIISDRIGKRSVVMAPMILVASVMMLTVKLYLTPDDVFSYYIVIFMIGIFLGGPYTTITSAISLDLSELPQVKSNKSALTSISTFVGSSASLCASIFQLIIPIAGQGNIFYLFFTLCLVATCLISKVAIKELKELRHILNSNKASQKST